MALFGSDRRDGAVRGGVRGVRDQGIQEGKNEPDTIGHLRHFLKTLSDCLFSGVFRVFYCNLGAICPYPSIGQEKIYN